jgi:hypothetical protein
MFPSISLYISFQHTLQHRSSVRSKLKGVQVERLRGLIFLAQLAPCFFLRAQGKNPELANRFQLPASHGPWYAMGANESDRWQIKLKSRTSVIFRCFSSRPIRCYRMNRNKTRIVDQEHGHKQNKGTRYCFLDAHLYLFARNVC